MVNVSLLTVGCPPPNVRNCDRVMSAAECPDVPWRRRVDPGVFPLRPRKYLPGDSILLGYRNFLAFNQVFWPSSAADQVSRPAFVLPGIVLLDLLNVTIASLAL